MAYQIQRPSNERSSSWNMIGAGEGALSFVAGALFGAGLMYLFDPQRGPLRRQSVKQTGSSYLRSAQEAAAGTARDLQNRAAGLAAESQHWFGTSDEDSNETLIQRVRSELGSWLADVHAVEISADQGNVVLKGKVLAHELGQLAERVRGIKGVRAVENQLSAMNH